MIGNRPPENIVANKSQGCKRFNGEAGAEGSHKMLGIANVNSTRQNERKAKEF